MASILTTQVVPGIQGFIQSCHMGAEVVKDWFVDLDTQIDTLTQQLLPTRIQKLVIELFRSLPETAVCFSVMTGVGVGVATIFWASRVIWIFSPLLTTLLSNDCSRDKLAASAADCITNLLDAYKKFRPAIAVTCATAAVACMALGWITTSYSLMISSTLYGVVAATMGEYLLTDRAATIAT